MLIVTFGPLSLSVNGPIAIDDAIVPLLRLHLSTVPSSAHFAMHQVLCMNADISSTRPLDIVATMFAGVVCIDIFS